MGQKAEVSNRLDPQDKDLLDAFDHDLKLAELENMLAQFNIFEALGKARQSCGILISWHSCCGRRNCTAWVMRLLSVCWKHVSGLTSL